jgi:hypothetical protein
MKSSEEVNWTLRRSGTNEMNAQRTSIRESLASVMLDRSAGAGPARRE